MPTAGIHVLTPHANPPAINFDSERSDLFQCSNAVLRFVVGCDHENMTELNPKKIQTRSIRNAKSTFPRRHCRPNKSRINKICSMTVSKNPSSTKQKKRNKYPTKKHANVCLLVLVQGQSIKQIRLRCDPTDPGSDA